MGDLYEHNSNRAELRAVIGVLQWCEWSQGCNRSWRSIVIATDSEYVAENAIERIQRWESNGWWLSSQNLVLNQDSWKLVLHLVRQLHGEGVNVTFWRIPREHNSRADESARRGALSPRLESFHMVKGNGPLEIQRVPHQFSA